MFEKYSKKRSDPDFCDGQSAGIGHSSKLITYVQIVSEVDQELT